MEERLRRFYDVHSSCVRPSDDLDTRILADAGMAREESSMARHSKPNVWRKIMENKVTKYSAAAVVALAMAMVLSNPFGTSGNGNVALADVQEKVKQINTMILRGQQIYTLASAPNISFAFDVDMYLSKQLGYTEKGYLNKTLVYQITLNRPQNQTLIVLPIWKKCLMFPCTDEQIKIMEMLTPHGLVDFFQQTDYESTGRSRIDGVEVDCFEVNGVKSFENFLPKFLFDIQKGSFKVWVDVKKLLPIRMEGDIFLGKSLGTVFTEGILHEVCAMEAYDVELDKSLFDCSLPDGYSELTLSDILHFFPMKQK
jgi:hypothetical protein